MRARPILAILLLPSFAAARGAPVVSFDDPAGDDTGTGSYSLPTGGGFQPGDFDLRHFEVRVEGDEAVLEVTLGNQIREPGSGLRQTFTPTELNNRIYLQNVDVYVDRTPGAGRSEGIPGRHVALEGGWDVAVVMTPLPASVRAVIESALGDAARDVIVPYPLEVRGRVIAARVPLRALGGTPTPEWGWSVHVSGASWDRTFDALNLLRDSREADAFTLPVRAVAEDFALGGGGTGTHHPNVIDVLLPPGADQRRVLGAYDEKAGTYARVPFLTGGPRAPRVTLLSPALRAPAAPAGLVVVQADREMVSAEGPVDSLKPLQFGVVLDEGGAEIGRVVVVKVLATGLVASVVEQKRPITAGARLRFDEAGPAPAEDP